MTTNELIATGERADILDFLSKHRYFLRHTANGLSDEQASTRSTVSALTVGGLIKHVTAVERRWADFAQAGGGPEVPEEIEFTPELIAEWENQFRLTEGETLAGVLAEYEKVAAATDELVRTLDLNSSYELPAAPWQPPGVFWSVRRVFLHIAAETAQHAGHADIIRESIDGQKTMG
ncbi:DinB family protein [Kribbella catacumbae]|uniref:DinB family protein n=1 Tax=Kribbella catacumbae TaxID=460086 RepID=UPI0003786C22|nr:DinB family protein [Kribbella catacumbae]